MIPKKSFTEIEKEIKAVFNKEMDDFKKYSDANSNGDEEYNVGYSDGFTDGIISLLRIMGIDIDGVTYDSEIDEPLIHKYNIDDHFMSEPEPLYYRDFYYIKGIADEKDDDGNVVYFAKKTHREDDLSYSIIVTITEKELDLLKKIG